jgi:LysR family transcriptional regulator (chromosome initiation inhibitor)
MDLNQDNLTTLAAVLREGTFDAAAASLHITPSAVSQRIKALETSTGRILLRRTKPVTATADGEVLARLTRQWDLLTAEAGLELRGTPDDDQTPLRDRRRIHLPIAANADSLATWLLPVLADFHRAHAVAVEVLRDDESRNSALLRSGDVLGAITSAPDAIRGTTVIPLGRMRYTPCATREFIDTWFPDGLTVDALRRAPVLNFDHDDQLQQRALAAFAERASSSSSLASTHPDPPVVYIPASTEFARAVELGIGWGVLPQAHTDAALGAGLVVELPGPPVDVALYWQSWKVGSPLLGALTDLMTAAAAAHLHPVAD